MTNTTVHQAVMVEETMLVLDVKPGGRYLDGTLGGATHTRELLMRSAPDGRVLSLDVNRKALAAAAAIPPYFIKDYMSAAQRYGLKGVTRILLLLHHYNLKSVGIDVADTPDASLLKEMVVKMMN